jgi:hypothetical protein
VKKDSQPSTTSSNNKRDSNSMTKKESIQRHLPSNQQPQATMENEKEHHDRIRDELMQIDESLPSTSNADEDIDMEFALSDGRRANEVKKGKDLGLPGSKMKRLKRMAEEVEKKRQRLESYKAQGETGKELYDKERWGDVIASASGDRAVIDGNKVKKAMKRIEKAKAKSSREWQARIDEVSKNKQAKQEKREQNLMARKQGSQPQTQTSIRAPGQSSAGENNKHVSASNAGRAGFEGKKVDFLNKGKASSSSSAASAR